MSVPRHRRVGVIGGMGPEATVELMRRVIVRTPAGDDADHVHLIVDSNPKIPSRIAHLIEGTGVDPEPAILEVARTLERAGADALAMPCNTAHHYARAIRNAVSVPLLDMIDLTADDIAAEFPEGRVGLLASTAVDRVGVYRRSFAARGLSYELPRRQDDLMSLIRGVKRGETGAKPALELAAIAAELEEGTDIVLIACSELSLISANIADSSVDSLDVLASAIVAFAAALDPRA
jgi:aspartate racemase